MASNGSYEKQAMFGVTLLCCWTCIHTAVQTHSCTHGNIDNVTSHVLVQQEQRLLMTTAEAAFASRSCGRTAKEPLPWLAYARFSGTFLCRAVVLQVFSQIAVQRKMFRSPQQHRVRFPTAFKMNLYHPSGLPSLRQGWLARWKAHGPSETEREDCSLCYYPHGKPRERYRVRRRKLDRPVDVSCTEV